MSSSWEELEELEDVSVGLGELVTEAVDVDMIVQLGFRRGKGRGERWKRGERV